jgi:hypothetical protein
MNKTTVSISADVARNKNLGFKPVTTGATPITGPFFQTYYRVRNPSRTTGWSYTTLDYRGGQSARTAAYDLQQASDATLTHFFDILRTDQGSGQKTIVICVNEGLNDRNETLASVGPAAVADGDSPDAFVDNITAIADRIKAIWTLNGWDQSELFWLLMVSHPQSTPDDAELITYRTALATFGATLQRAQVIDVAAIAPHADFVANSWYASSGADTAHLANAAAYQAVAVRILGAML